MPRSSTTANRAARRYIDATRAGDRLARDAAFAELLPEIEPGIRAICKAVDVRSKDTDDLVQDALVAAARDMPRYFKFGVGSVAGWCMAVAHQTCVDAIRHDNRACRVEPSRAADAVVERRHDDASELEHFEQFDSYVSKVDAMLGQRDGRVLRRMLRGQRGREIRAALGLTKMQLAAARRRIRRAAELVVAAHVNGDEIARDV